MTHETRLHLSMVIRRMHTACDEAGECINHDSMPDVEAACYILEKLTQAHANAMNQLTASIRHGSTL